MVQAMAAPNPTPPQEQMVCHRKARKEEEPGAENPQVQARDSHSP